MSTNSSRQKTGEIVVGVDGSPGSEHALRWAVEEAAITGARVRAVHAWMPPASGTSIDALVDPSLDAAPYEAAALNLVEVAVEKARTNVDVVVDIEPTIELGFAPDVLMNAGDSADLLVLGSRGRGGFRGLLLGSVSQKCAEYSTSPVAIIPAHAALPNNDDVVVGIDGSEPSRRALARAIDEACARGARLVVVHTWYTPVAVPPMGIVITPTNPELFRADSDQLLRKVSNEALAASARKPVDVKLVSVEEPAAMGLLSRAEGANLLVVGGRGRGGFASLLLGSVSQQCIHHPPCAVIVVHDRRSTR